MLDDADGAGCPLADPIVTGVVVVQSAPMTSVSVRPLPVARDVLALAAASNVRAD